MAPHWINLPINIFTVILESMDMETISSLCHVHSWLNNVIVNIRRAQAALRLVAPSSLACILFGLDPTSATSINQGDYEYRDHQYTQHLWWVHEIALSISICLFFTSFTCPYVLHRYSKSPSMGMNMAGTVAGCVHMEGQLHSCHTPSKTLGIENSIPWWL